MTLSLPHTFSKDEPAKPEELQEVFDEIAKQFPVQPENIAFGTLAVWKPLFRPEPARTINATGTGVVICGQVDGFPTTVAGNNIADVFHLTAADLAVTGKTTKLRVRAIVACNPTAPACTFTYAMRTAALGGAAGTISFTAAGVATSAFAIATPTASAYTGAAGTEFTVPADGAYIFTVDASVAQAANSMTVHNIVLEYRHV